MLLFKILLIFGKIDLSLKFRDCIKWHINR